MDNYKYIKKYNTAWSSGEIREPVVILIGGYAGTGKTTIANVIKDHIPNVNVLPTGVVRSVVQSFIGIKENPYLYSHTFDLYKFTDTKTNNLPQILNGYFKQVKPVADAINQTIKFVSTEKQHFIFDGNHIFPGLMKPVPGVIFIELYLKVTDEKAHRKMLGGPTHNRLLTDKQFKTGRIIQDYIVSEAKKFTKPVFEYDDSVEKTLNLIDATIGQYLKENPKEVGVTSYRELFIR